MQFATNLMIELEMFVCGSFMISVCMYGYQFGFRKGHSTQQAIITRVNKIISCLDNGDLVIGVFLDLKKSFDTVDHKILLKKLYAYGVRDVALKLL